MIIHHIYNDIRNQLQYRMIKLANNLVFTFARAVKNQSNLRLPSFQHFVLEKPITQYLQERQLHTPTFIQYALLAKLNQNNNSSQKRYHIVSPTGSGKTMAYMLPILNHLRKQENQAQECLTKSQRPRALILTSSKQLVLQVRNAGKDICHYAKLKCEGLGIGRTLIEQREKMQQGVDVLVTGYTRFKRMLDNRQVYLSNLSWIVVDQIDTIYDSQKSLTQLIFSTIIKPKLEKQKNINLIFASTTNPPSLKQYLEGKVPKLQQIIDKNVHLNLHNIKHEFLHCSTLDKHEPLLQQIRRDRKSKLLIFCNTVKSLHQLEYFLNQQGIPTHSLHSQLTKQSRIKSYQVFRDSQTGILLSTDLGARGLHFPRLRKVINYDFPLTTCDYLQRAGRTGRAGEKGTVVSLYFKKNLPIIDELKGASFETPLKITNSAYSFKNREETKKPSKFHKKQSQ